MKRALSGALAAAMAAGAKLQVKEILSGPSLEDDGSSGPWSAEEAIVSGSKKVFLLAAGAAMQKYREKLTDQQEIVAALADIVIEIFAMESALLRAENGNLRPAAKEAVAAQVAAPPAFCYKTALAAPRPAHGRYSPPPSMAICCRAQIGRSAPLRQAREAGRYCSSSQVA